MSSFHYPVTKFEVIDGDSVRVWLDRGWGDTKRIICRLYGIDAPEIRNAQTILERDAANEVMLAVDRWLQAAQADELCSVSMDKGDWVGRYFGDIMRGKQKLSSALFGAQLVKAYEGKRRAWTPQELDTIETRAKNVF